MVLSESTSCSRRQRCTADSIRDMVSYLEDARYSGRTAQVAFPNIHKALDLLPHEALLHRLLQCSVSGRALAYLRALLVGRSLHVRLANLARTPRPLCQGVLQGRVLSSLLFNIAKASLPHCLPECHFPRGRLVIEADEVVL